MPRTRSGGKGEMKEVNNEAFSLKEHLQQLEESLVTSEIRKSVEALARILKGGFFKFGSSGRI